MNINMPGAFPGTIPEDQEMESVQSSQGFRAPSAAEFTFTSPSRLQSLYPNLDDMTSDKLQQECQNLGYSKKLSNKVLEELDKRAATKVRNSHINKKSVLSPRSSRFNSSHRTKFQKMESISSHYAAVRNKSSISSLRREEVEMEKENVPSYDPNTKRSSVSILGSASKRRRTATGRQEISIPPPAEYKDSRIPRSPSKANLRETATTSSSRTIPRSTSTMSVKNSSIPHSRTISHNISSLTAAKQLPCSSTMRNLMKPTASSLQRSSSNKNLGQTLRSQQSMSSISTSSSSTSSSSSMLPRMKSSMNLRQQAGSKPVWR